MTRPVVPGELWTRWQARPERGVIGGVKGRARKTPRWVQDGPLIDGYARPVQDPIEVTASDHYHGQVR